MSETERINKNIVDYISEWLEYLDGRGLTIEDFDMLRKELSNSEYFELRRIVDGGEPE